MNETVLGLLAVGFIIMVLLGYLLVVLVSSWGISSKLAWALAPVVGMGVCSIIFFFFRRPMFTIEFTLLTILFLVWLLHRRKTRHGVATEKLPIPILSVWLVGALTWATFASFSYVELVPHGEWDGFVIWNSHARYLYRAGAVWEQYIRNSVHSDYPLLLPAATARLWRYIGKDPAEAGGIQGVMLMVSGVLILAASLWELRPGPRSFLAPLILLGTPYYLSLGSWQYADVPLSVYILSTVALICVYWDRQPERGRLLILAGFTAGCAAWTKNEGLLFVLVASAMLLLPVIRQPAKTARRFAVFSLGLLLPLAATVYFKFTVPPPNDVVGNRDFAELLEKILDPSRYATIAGAFLKEFISFGHGGINPGIALIALLVTYGIDRRFVRNRGWVFGASVLVVTLAGYFAIYVITPFSLAYHLPSSLDRLLMHLWPALLLLAGLALKRSSSKDSTTSPV